MGGCCCHVKDDDQQEEKCVIVKSEEPQSPRKEYGSLSTMEDKQELYYEEPREPDKLLEKYEEQDGSTTSSQSEEEQEFSEALSTTNGDPGDESQVGVTLQEPPSSAGLLSTPEDVAAESDTLDREQSDVDREIDELVAAAMATKVIYPPSAPQQETSLSHPAEAASSISDPPLSPRALQDPSLDQEADSDEEANSTKHVSFIKRTQRSIKRAKAKAASMVSSPSKHKDSEQAEKQSGSFKDESTSKREAQRTLSGKDREDLLAKKSESRKYKGSAPGERMKSRYAKDRMSKLGVERDVRAKIAARRSANDPRKAALERGERLGQLDDKIDEMRDHSSSFAQVARQLKEEQRNRTTSFPW